MCLLDKRYRFDSICFLKERCRAGLFERVAHYFCYRCTFVMCASFSFRFPGLASPPPPPSFAVAR